jgi:hypothetical protein
MDTPTIEQIRVVIARFMGMEGTDVFLSQNYQYDKSWDLLMPVIEKISKIPLLESDGTPCADPQETCWPRTFGMPTEDGKRVMFRFNSSVCHEDITLINAAFNACYDFIRFENNKQKGQ